MKTRHLAAVAAIALAATSAWALNVVSVDQHNLSFNMPVLTMNGAGVVAFTNNDTTSHNILISGEGVNLNSGLQSPGVTFKAPMAKPGTYNVTCGIHPKMKMTIVVK